MSRHSSRGPVGPAGAAEPDARFGRAWRDHHRYVLDIAFRTLGNLASAEDVVQEAYARLLRVDIAEIDDLRGWLVVATGRLCIDKLRADRRRPTAPDELPDGSPRLVDKAPGPDDRVTLDDHVRVALHLVLERLTPAERTAFVLHDVFGYAFDEVAEIVGRTPAACRQLASRARRSMRTEGGEARFTVDPAEQRRVTERFVAASATGDLEGLLTVLDPEVAGQAELAAHLPQPPIVVGAEEVATRILHFFGPETSTVLLSVPAEENELSFVAFRDHSVFALVTLTLRDGLVHHIHSLVDPVRLAPLTRAFTP
jgi:RNA polymerase sigma-70 factor (ECF subfamily)